MLAVDEAYLHVLANAAAGEIAAAGACMIRKNAESFPLLEVDGIDADPSAPFLPYRDGNDDPALVSRYAQLGELAPDTFGYAFWDHFKRNGFAFPGDPNGLAEDSPPRTTARMCSAATPPHRPASCAFRPSSVRCTPTTRWLPRCCRCCSRGTSGSNSIAGSTTGAFEPEKFWIAWDRGNATTVDLLDAGWDFWAATQWPLEELRRNYNVPAVDPALVA